MGGGASVEFTINLNGFHFSLDKRMVHPEEPLIISSWDCFDYMNGMDNLRGDMLKVTEFIYEVQDEDLDWLRTQGVQSDEQFWCPKTTFSYVHGGGYTRSKTFWEDAFPMTLTGTVQLDYLGECEVSITVDAADTAEMKDFFQDVFETILDEDDVEEYNTQRANEGYDGGGCVNLEILYEIHNEYARDMYGAVKEKV